VTTRTRTILLVLMAAAFPCPGTVAPSESVSNLEPGCSDRKAIDY
jgi:hypothetical protein